MFNNDELAILYRGLEDREEIVQGQFELGTKDIKIECEIELKEIEILKTKILNMKA
jgi:hypothetical protein